MNAGGSTADAAFRPRPAAVSKDGRYEARNVVVEGCTFVGGGAAVAFVGVNGAAFRFNTVYRPGRYAVLVL